MAFGDNKPTLPPWGLALRLRLRPTAGDTEAVKNFNLSALDAEISQYQQDQINLRVPLSNLLFVAISREHQYILEVPYLMWSDLPPGTQLETLGTSAIEQFTITCSRVDGQVFGASEVADLQVTIRS